MRFISHFSNFPSLIFTDFILFFGYAELCILCYHKWRLYCAIVSVSAPPLPLMPYSPTPPFANISVSSYYHKDKQIKYFFLPFLICTFLLSGSIIYPGIYYLSMRHSPFLVLLPVYFMFYIASCLLADLGNFADSVKIVP